MSNDSGTPYHRRAIGETGSFLQSLQFTHYARTIARSLARKALLYLVGAVNCLFCQMGARSRSIGPRFGLAQLLSLPLLYAPRATERRTRRAGEGWAEQSAAKGIRRPQGAEGRSLSFSTSPRGSSQVWERRESLSLN